MWIIQQFPPRHCVCWLRWRAPKEYIAQQGIHTRREGEAHEASNGTVARRQPTSGRPRRGARGGHKESKAAFGVESDGQDTQHHIAAGGGRSGEAPGSRGAEEGEGERPRQTWGVRQGGQGRPTGSKQPRGEGATWGRMERASRDCRRALLSIPGWMGGAGGRRRSPEAAGGRRRPRQADSSDQSAVTPPH